MSANYFVDTNILIYTRDSSETEKLPNPAFDFKFITNVSKNNYYGTTRHVLA